MNYNAQGYAATPQQFQRPRPGGPPVLPQGAYPNTFNPGHNAYSRQLRNRPGRDRGRYDGYDNDDTETDDYEGRDSRAERRYRNDTGRRSGRRHGKYDSPSQSSSSSSSDDSGTASQGSRRTAATELSSDEEVERRSSKHHKRKHSSDAAVGRKTRSAGLMASLIGTVTGASNEARRKPTWSAPMGTLGGAIIQLFGKYKQHVAKQDKRGVRSRKTGKRTSRKGGKGQKRRR